MFQEIVPNTYDFTKLFALWKDKGSKLYLSMMRYIHRKDWDAKLLEALASERMKPYIIKNCPKCANRGNKKNLKHRALNSSKIMDENN